MRLTLYHGSRVPEVSAEALFWAGYLYRYWHFVTGETSADIYGQAPLEVLLDVYPGMHALAPEMAIEDLKKTVLKRVV